MYPAVPLCVTLLGHEDVGRLQVAVNDASTVRRSQGLCYFDTQLQGPLQGHAPLRDLVTERLPAQVLLHHVVHTVVGAHVVDGRDMRVIQRRRSASFLLETTQALRVGRKLRRQHLDRDLAAEPCVLGEVHLPHTAFADLVADLVGAEPSSIHGGEGYRAARTLFYPGGEKTTRK